MPSETPPPPPRPPSNLSNQKQTDSPSPDLITTKSLLCEKLYTKSPPLSGLECKGNNDENFNISKPTKTPPNTPPIASTLLGNKSIEKINLHENKLISNDVKDQNELDERYNSSNLVNKTNYNQQFCLRWNNYQSNLTSVFDQLLQNESFVDVTLACDGQSIKAHKMVLSACSPYFQALFFDNPCQHPVIIMRDVKWIDLKALVDFMYKGEINVNQEQIGPLLKLAETLKIRGLADVSNDPDGCADIDAGINETDIPQIAKSKFSETQAQKIDLTNLDEGEKNMNKKEHNSKNINDLMAPSFDLSSEIPNKKTKFDWEIDNIEINSVLAHHHRKQLEQNRKRRWPSLDNSENPLFNQIDVREDDRDTAQRINRSDSELRSNRSAISCLSTPDLSRSDNVPSPMTNSATIGSSGSSSQKQLQQQQHSHTVTRPSITSNPSPISNFSLPGQLDALLLPPAIGGTSSSNVSHIDDLEIKPGIAEMIREEERAKLMENSHAWLGASTIADSYQYQLQSMWQKCWNQNQNLMHHLRFRERGPLKSWRPETMAEAIFSVLKEGLSLSQAARKYDIPYPTFVLYANRVHNMLGPSVDSGPDLRPKGRGRPQRILLGIWPDEHIKGVIKTVVFRDVKELKDEASLLHLQYGRTSPIFPFQDSPLGYSGHCGNGLPGSASSGSESMSPEATVAAVAAVAHGIRQQMQMAAVGHHQDTSNLFISNQMQNTCSTSIQKQNSPTPGNRNSCSNLNERNLCANLNSSISSNRLLPSRSPLSITGINNLNVIPCLNNPNSSPINHSNNHPPQTNSPLPHDLHMQSPDLSPQNSPSEMQLESAVNLAVSGMAYKSTSNYPSPRSEKLFTEDISDIVSSQNNCGNNFKDSTANSIKIEQISECRNE